MIAGCNRKTNLLTYLFRVSTSDLTLADSSCAILEEQRLRFKIEQRMVILSL